MAMARERMLEAFLTSDRRFDGRFLSGVLTTGIYCLPSCRARKPRPQNVRFFPLPDEAEAAGLRPCKRCRPDLFYQQRDPGRETVEELLRLVHRDPAAHASVAAMARAVGFGSSKLTELCRRYLHCSPRQLLATARIRAALVALAETRHSVSDIAFAVGYESLSSFQDAFRRRTRTSPQGFRKLLEGQPFTLSLPPRYRAADTLAYLGRDPDSRCERVVGKTLGYVSQADDPPLVVEIDLATGAAHCRPQWRRPPEPAAAARLHQEILRLLGLGQDPSAFERRADADPILGGIVAARRGLVVPQTPSAFAGLCWVIAGQQVHLGLACALRRRLVERAGTPVDGLVAHPTPAQVAALSPSEVGELGFSRFKSQVLTDLAAAVTSGDLPLEALGDRTVDEAAERLLAARGLGPWSVQYLLMRSYGFADCLPSGDAGLRRALWRAFSLAERPDEQQIQSLMAPFAPYRSLATFHLWSTLEDS